MTTHARAARLPRYVAPVVGGNIAAWLAEVTTDAAWGAWEYVETAGTTLADSSGNSRPLSITGSPTLAQAGPDGANDAVSWPNAAAYAQTAVTVTTSPCTWSTFVYLTANPAVVTSVCAIDIGGGAFDKCLYIDTSGVPKFYVFQGSGRHVSNGTALALNTWHHIACSVGSAGEKIRVDKVTGSTDTLTTGSYTGGAGKASIRNAPGAMNSGPNANGTAPMLIGPTAFFTSQLSNTRTDAHKDAMF